MSQNVTDDARPSQTGGKGMGFTKLDENILQSSIMMEDPNTFKIFITLLAACKGSSVAKLSAVFLSSVCRMSLEQVTEALDRLESPDPQSRSLNDEGRRIRRVDGGYEVINYAKYRAYTYSDSPEAIRQRKKRERDIALHVTDPRDISVSVSASVSASAIDIPSSLSSSSLFLSSWEEWHEYRKELKKKMTPRSEKATLKKLASIGPERAIAAIENSIANGWTGIFEPIKPKDKRQDGAEYERF